MSKCPFCGEELPSDDVWYCPHCGSRLRDFDGKPLFQLGGISEVKEGASLPSTQVGVQEASPERPKQPQEGPPKQVAQTGQESTKRVHPLVKAYELLVASMRKSYEALSEKDRLFVFFLMFEFLVISTLVGAGMPISAGQAQAQVQGLNSSLPSGGKESVALYIFANNYRISVYMAIPIAGPLLGSIVSFQTGYVMAAQATAYPQLYGASTGAIRFLTLMATPIFWLEFLSYSAATAESIYLTLALFRRNFRKEVQNAFWLFLLIAVVLFVSAQMEAFLFMRCSS